MFDPTLLQPTPFATDGFVTPEFVKEFVRLTVLVAQEIGNGPDAQGVDANWPKNALVKHNDIINNDNLIILKLKYVK